MRYAIVALSFLVLVVTNPAAGGTSFVTTVPSVPDPRFLLQTQAGLSAYINTEPLSLDYVRPLFSEISIETDSYILGEYTLSGRAASVGLAIGSDGWVVAFHDQHTHVGQLVDCHGNDLSKSRVEWAVEEIAQALEIDEPAIYYHDFREQADAIIIHWLYLAQSGNDESTINLPLANSYLDRGYAFCTALSGSRFWLNGEMVDQQGSVSNVVRRWGLLGSDQLRAGQTNELAIQATSFFGTGFTSAVAATYQGEAEIVTQGGSRRDLNLRYPTMLGEPLTIYHNYLPAVNGGD